MKLNKKHSLFIKYYLQSRNATDAALKAGYCKSRTAAKVTGSRLLTNLAIKNKIDAEHEKLAAKCDITAEKVIREIASIAELKLNKNDLKKSSANKLRALEMLAKHFNLFSDQTIINNNNVTAPQVVVHLPGNGSENETQSDN